MTNTFLFIIPLTPASHLTENRRQLQRLCLDTLVSQSYSGWKALLIGKTNVVDPIDERFIILDFEGHKEEKLQKATEYIDINKIDGNYIIRLDDDDVFNPGILDTLKEKDFDICVDRYHSFWNAASGQVAQTVMYWFPNSCIHKRQHALSYFGAFPPGNYIRFKSKSRLIENEHNDFNKYYSQKNNIIYSSKNNPVYLRSLSMDSITSLQSSDFSSYLNQHGYWKTNTLSEFKFLNQKVNGAGSIKQGVIARLKAILYNLRTVKNYQKVLINK